MQNKLRLLEAATKAGLLVAGVAVAIILLNKLGMAFPVRGVSMHPVIENGDLVLTRPCDVSELSTGTIIVYRDPFDRLIVHRVVKIGDGYVLVKGDNNPLPDSNLVTGRNLVGCVFLTIKRAGLVVEPPVNYVIAFALFVLFMLNLVTAVSLRKSFIRV